jgi:hypothetical protein
MFWHCYSDTYVKGPDELIRHFVWLDEIIILQNGVGDKHTIESENKAITNAITVK